MLRALAQQGASPDVARLSDEQETRMSLALAGIGRPEGALGQAVSRRARLRRGLPCDLRLRGRTSATCRRGASARCALARDGGGLVVGRSPGEAWRAGRFAAPYLRDELLTQGVMVETLETATQWSNLTRLHGLVATAIGARAERRRHAGTGHVPRLAPV